MQYDDVIKKSGWRTDTILKIVFGYISAPYWPINVGVEVIRQVVRLNVFILLFSANT